MTSREEFLVAIQNNLADKFCVNYFASESSGFSISSADFKNVADKVYEMWVNIIDGGSQFVGVLISDYLWVPCLLLSIWKSGNACACVGNQYAEEYNINFMDFLNVRYLITDDDKVWPSFETIYSFQINYQKFCIKKRKFCSGISVDSDKVPFTICYGIMTSGTTGMPKIIQVPWSCILLNVYELISLFSITEDDNVCLLSPYTFDPFFVELFMSLITGCCLTIVSPSIKMCSQILLKIFFDKQDCNYEFQNAKESNLSIACKTKKINNSLITILQMTPSLFKRWNAGEIKNFILSDDSILRILLLGGERFPTDLLRLKSKGNKTRIINIYGITEISCWAFVNDVTETNGEVSLGTPLNDILYKIDESGELHLGSQKRKCIVNAERNIESDEVVYRRTGDLVSQKNGKIYYMSRTSQLVKKFGIKINLEKIENSFSSSHSHIPECACVFDENSMTLALFYTNNNLKSDYLIISGEEQKRLERFKGPTTNSIEVPDYVIEMRKMPVNDNGKRDKKALLELLRNVMKSKIVVSNTGENFKNVWTSLVEGNNFVLCGGDSVKALQILTRLEEIGIEVPENFLGILLKDGDYDNCLDCLISSGAKNSKKKFKFDDVVESFYFLISWSFDTEKCIDASPTIYEKSGVAYAIVGSHSSKLSSLRIDSGEKNWTIKLGGRIESGVHADKSSTFGLVGCYDNYVYCISLASGEIIWKYKTEGMIKSTPCLSSDEKIVYVASYDTFLYCLEVRTGRFISKVKLSDRGIFSSGIISDDLKAFYIATLDGTCVSLSQETNNVLWRQSLENPVFASPLLIDDGPSTAVVFVEVTGHLHCFDAKTGIKMWHYGTNACIYSTPVFRSKFIIFGCYNNRLYCLKTSQEPTLQWECEVDSPVFAKPCFFSTTQGFFVVAASTKGWIYLCELESGSKVARTKLDGEVFSSPKVYRDNLVLGCRDNNLYCMKIVESASKCTPIDS